MMQREQEAPASKLDHRGVILQAASKRRHINAPNTRDPNKWLIKCGCNALVCENANTCATRPARRSRQVRHRENDPTTTPTGSR